MLIRAQRLGGCERRKRERLAAGEDGARSSLRWQGVEIQRKQSNILVLERVLQQRKPVGKKQLDHFGRVVFNLDFRRLGCLRCEGCGKLSLQLALGVR